MSSAQNDQQRQQNNSGANDQDGDAQLGGGQSTFRPIVPGPSFPDQGVPTAGTKRTMGASWKKRVSTACLACKKSKRKCSGTPPCDNCRALHRECIFDESLDQRRRVAAKRTAEELEYHRDMLNDLFKVIRTADEKQAQRLLELIRSDATPEEIRLFIDEVLVQLQTFEPSSRAKRETTAQLKELRSQANMQGSAPSFRRQVMDVNFLCVIPPIAVPASPWTTVTDDDAFVSHLISLYFTWDYPFYSFLDLNVLINHMKSRDLNSQYCSPFLVNALLSHACYSEAYGIPGDITSKGSKFLKEAEKCLEQRSDDVSLSSLQGTMILYERYSMTGQDDLGYAMLYKAIDIAEQLGYIGGEGQDVDLSHTSKDFYNSAIKTVWGLFQLDTVAHTGFLKPCRIRNVRLSRTPALSIERDSDYWSPYPSQKPPRKAYFVTYFDKACTLSEIARDISITLFADEIVDDKERLSAAVDSLYQRMKRWHESLPYEFHMSKKPAPHILLLHIRYHTILISMFNCPRGHNDQDRSTDLGTATVATRSQMPEGGEDPASIATSSARAIAKLIRVHQEEYGISRSHVFALYAVNLALFLLLEYDTFDISDPDCVSLTSAFSIITTRSILGREVRSIFRRSVSKKKSDGESRWEQLPEGLREILEDDPFETSGSEADHDGHDGISDEANHEGNTSTTTTPLSPTEEDRRVQKLKKNRGPQEGSRGLCEMLCRYETMTLGRDDQVTGKK
ncbi:C6 transcription factor, putative [Talaromyces stipitatus ATCC 10500]|uniref:C6 transcription factor, putative n=1 Tax=Talaromyces stipitatus (strain ATCC 10500 / CBS 375.48 / QM 6759 / NRRL 1006) TaxID=441959 RepID=B8M494_TALSN|nr:C6 transcription factor, putative [Talaromyces stipitatus ATCC 10500]EED19089.1 C6 transcription factor, putative [Talaromyces stipitatus ATCC 10500]